MTKPPRKPSKPLLRETDIPAHYPLLSAEVGITAETLAGVADAVSRAYGQWQLIGGQIKRARLNAKAAIDLANTVEEARRPMRWFGREMRLWLTCEGALHSLENHGSHHAH
jgi:hypothetical protein